MLVRVQLPHPIFEGVFSQKLKVVFASLFCVALLSFSAGATLESDVSAIKSDVAINRTNISSILTHIIAIESDVDTTRANVSTISTYVSSYLSNLSNLSTINSNLVSIKSDVDLIHTNTSNISTYSSGIHGMFQSLNTNLGSGGYIGSRINSLENNTDDLEDDTNELVLSIHALQEFFVNSHHKDLEDVSEDSVDEATSMYSSSQGGSTTAQKNSAISGFSSSISSGLETGVSSDSVWDLLTDGDTGSDYQQLLPSGRSGNIFAFFSTETLNDLDAVPVTRGSQPDIVDYLTLNNRSFVQLKDGVNNDLR